VTSTETSATPTPTTTLEISPTPTTIASPTPTTVKISSPTPTPVEELMESGFITPTLTLSLVGAFLLISSVALFIL